VNNFKGKKALITGGSRGIGASIVEDLQDRGCEVWYTSRSDESSKNHIKVDFLDRASVRNFESIISKMDFNICINNAGINKVSLILDFEESDWRDIIEVNLNVPFLVCRAVIPGMKRIGSGKILNVSSIWGTIGKEGRSAYAASKFGIRGLTLALADELAENNILVNTIAPGFTETDLTERILGKEGMDAIASKIPMKRLAKAGEISKAALFLVSDDNSYITGQHIVVDGGFTNV
jgi:3-oxoacyl-[acyl-carrier protein] reductase